MRVIELTVRARLSYRTATAFPYRLGMRPRAPAGRARAPAAGLRGRKCAPYLAAANELGAFGTAVGRLRFAPAKETIMRARYSSCRTCAIATHYTTGDQCKLACTCATDQHLPAVSC